MSRGQRRARKKRKVRIPVLREIEALHNDIEHGTQSVKEVSRHRLKLIYLRIGVTIIIGLLAVATILILIFRHRLAPVLTGTGGF